MHVLVPPPPWLTTGHFAENRSAHVMEYTCMYDHEQCISWTDQNTLQKLPYDDVMELDLFCLYVTYEVLEHFVEAANEYANAQKASTPATYLWFKKSPFTKDEALQHIWVLLLLSINSVQSYQKVWTRGGVHRLVWLVICTSVHACM